MLMTSEALAQGLFGGGAAASSSSNPTISMLIQFGYFIPLILIFYLLLIRPQQVQAKKTKQMLAALKRGDHVVTSGGIVGTIIKLEDHKVVLRVANDVNIEFVRTAVVNVLPEESGK
jgi:preprotein translocase subunit YajC